MATDATGTPTSGDSIPTYNTAVDKPSGLGFNAAMTDIQTALNKRLKSVDTPAEFDVPVWNGTTWQYQQLSTSSFQESNFGKRKLYREVTATGALATTEKNLLTYTLPGGTIGTTGQIELEWIGAATTGTTATDMDFRLDFGGVEQWDENMVVDVSEDMPIRVHVIINARDSASLQDLSILTMLSDSTPNTGIGASPITSDKQIMLGASTTGAGAHMAVDTNSNQVLQLKVQSPTGAGAFWEGVGFVWHNGF